MNTDQKLCFCPIRGAGGLRAKACGFSLVFFSFSISDIQRSKGSAMAEEGIVIGCHSVEQWKKHLELAIETKKLVVVDFTATWCGPCRIIAPIFAELAKKFPNVLFLKVDVDELKSVAQDWAIEAMPTFIFLKDGTIVDKIVGAHKDELPKKIELHLNLN